MKNSLHGQFISLKKISEFRQANIIGLVLSCCTLWYFYIAPLIIVWFRSLRILYAIFVRVF
jgi:hypothetical protein